MIGYGYVRERVTKKNLGQNYLIQFYFVYLQDLKFLSTEIIKPTNIPQIQNTAFKWCFLFLLKIETPFKKSVRKHP